MQTMTLNTSMNFLSGTKTIPKHYSKWSGGKDKLGFLRQVKKQNKQNKAHLNKKEKEKERKRERKKKERSRHQ